ncbi:methylamine utilization protein MauE [Streptomyces chromofuscus]|uniref:Methylamine utilization protein MauE n=1 Tax=Streptomyces chromofuscus TaxID=42881 RepID=A0A7M2T802_STRCW|nr:MauE/DoxX family redox-associated membrane protein [Streptomyces chromofuscus]QOV44837.1 methylamine utilization protein MauE [Streptomyces chromofuscus]
MTDFYGGLTAAIVTLVLLWGAGAHAARPAALGEALREHGVLSSRLLRCAAVALPVAEGALGAAGAGALLAGHQRGLQAVLAAAALLFALYAGYTRHVLALGHGGPCGCSHRDVPLSRWVTRRAAVLACLALTGAILAASGPVELSATELTTLLLAAPACTVLLWVLPAAMHEPTAATVHRPPTATHHHPSTATAHHPTTATAHRPSEATAHHPPTAPAHQLLTPPHQPTAPPAHQTPEGVPTRWTSPPAP